MSDKTKIEWADTTWNPIAGCSKVSAGCENCYAIEVAHGLEKRFASEKYKGLTKKLANGQLNWTGEVILIPEILEQPLRWTKPRKIFVNSMSDLFHEKVSIQFIAQVFAIMFLSEKHIFQILTKRPERMLQVLNSEIFFEFIHGYCNKFHSEYIRDLEQELYFFDEIKSEFPLKNVCLGVSVEDQATADERIPLLLQTPAAVRFISAEPLLGKIDLSHEWGAYQNGNDSPLRKKIINGLDWVIVGGESGHKARPMHPDWVRKIRDDCKSAGVPFFFKQWGEFSPYKKDGKWVFPKVGKHKAGRFLDGVEHNEFPISKIK